MANGAPKERQAQFLENACDATRLLGKRRQLFDMKERFAAEKEHYDDRCKTLAQKDAELTARDLEFQAKLVRLKIFSRENESKQKKLARRTAEEVKICEDLDTEAAGLTESLNEKPQQLKQLEDISEAIDKYESLKASREGMEGKLKSIEATIETNRRDGTTADAAIPQNSTPIVHGTTAA